MEGIAFVLIGAALFSHSWYLMGLYAEARSVGIIMLAIAVGLLFTLTFDPQILATKGSVLDQARDANIMKAIIAVWAVYAAGVAAQGYWDMEEHTIRPLGFYSVILTLTNAAAVLYFVTVVPDFYSAGIVILFALAAFILTVASVFLFLYLAIPSLRSLKLVTSWVALGGSIIVTVIGLIIASTIVVA